MSLHCQNCNASLNGPVCDYCGRQAHVVELADEEKEKLADYHKKLQENAKEGLGELLTHGFMPETAEGLLAAGLGMLPLIKTDDLSYDDTKAAVGRLSAVITRLKLVDADDKIQTAIGEFEKIVADYQREDRNLGIACGVIVGVLVLIGICAGMGFFG
ncbi:MAG: hypothetical protein AB8G95_11935 [Anaerolineae bacterium]